MKARITKIVLIAVALLVILVLVVAIWHPLVPSRAYSVSYGHGPAGYTDGALFRPWDIRIADQLLKGQRIFCVQVPQWSPHKWNQWLIVDFDREMFYFPSMPPDSDGLNQYLGVELTNEGKIGARWKVSFSAGQALCYASSGEWCLLTPTP